MSRRIWYPVTLEHLALKILILQVHFKAASLLSRPFAGRIRRAGRNPYSARADVNEH